MSVTVSLMGGAANQLFQYAVGLAVAEHVGAELFLDVSRYDAPNEYRLYSLGLFAGVTERVVRGQSGRVIREQGMPYKSEVFACATRDCTLVGYWQTERYFAGLKDVLREKLRPREPLPPLSTEMLGRIEAEGSRSVFLTVRRTDYVGNDFHGLLPYDYYLRAATKIAERIDDPCFFIFSDDPLWCEQHFQLPYRSVVAGNYDRSVPGHLGREDAELFLMSRCSHAIMANSSYSWWGAWLGKPDDTGIVVAPKAWFGPKGTEDPRDICPARWVRL